MSWLKKLKSGLGKTSARVTASLGAVLGCKGIDAASLEEVEDALISADLGTAAAAKLAERMRKHKFEGEVSASALAAALSDGITDILAPVAQPLLPDETHRPHVVLLVGVNGSGKTTTAWQAGPAMGSGRKEGNACRG
jgi:fused signal recognition particle receptor